MQLQHPSLLQNQKLTMNPKIYQSIKMMALPIMDLREKIEEELEKNPALEVLEDSFTVSLDAATKPKKEVYEFFESSSDSGFSYRSGEAAADERRRFIEGALSHPETLQEHLLWQLRLEPIGAEIRRISELLIQNLDEDGFHKEQVDILLQDENPRVIEKALELVRGLDPAGTCTSDYMESLRVQIGLLADPPRGILEALSHLELLERGKIAEAAKKMACTIEEVKLVLEKIKGLSPFPGRRFATGVTRYVVPDIEVIKKDGDFVIILNEEEIPVLGINPFFMKIAGSKAIDSANGGACLRLRGLKAEKKRKKEDKPVRDFARENIKEARWFINSINQRNHTLLRVSRAIVEFQRPFFTNGPKFLAPLTLRDISGELDLHETTVSRTSNGKYMQTEWGIFELRHFFSNSITGTGSGASVYSKEGVKQIIREIIMAEQSNLSDNDIVELLAKRGVNLARRTVAKYRGELDLGSSFKR
jgi:RNA polymerase sigma-54 factor